MSDLKDLEKKYGSNKTREALSSSLGSTISLGIHEFSETVKSLFGKTTREQWHRWPKTKKNQIALDREKFEDMWSKMRKS